MITGFKQGKHQPFEEHKKVQTMTDQLFQIIEANQIEFLIRKAHIINQINMKKSIGIFKEINNVKIKKLTQRLIDEKS